MSSGLLALLDDVAGLAKVAAASVDDIGGMAAKAGTKSAGLVIDDAAVAPRFVVGFAAERELPIVMKIAKGSIKNKLLFLLPAALILGALAPWLITPILMMGGLFLCFEGAEKVLESFFPHGHHAETPNTDGATLGQSEEDRRVKSAIQTDFILSAEIMAIALSVLPSSTLFEQAVTLAVVAIGITALVYGAVALIVKADDIGVYLAQNGRFALTRGFGRGIVRAMPYLLKALKIIGTAAMLLVGGGILLHGLEHLGLHGPMHMLHEITGHFAHGGFWGWLSESSLTALVGLVVGLLVVPVVIYLIAPLAKRFRRKPAA